MRQYCINVISPEYVKGIVWEDVLVLRRGTLADAGENSPVSNVLGNGSSKTRQTRLHTGTSVGLRSERRGREKEREREGAEKGEEKQSSKAAKCEQPANNGEGYRAVLCTIHSSTTDGKMHKIKRWREKKEGSTRDAIPENLPIFKARPSPNCRPRERGLMATSKSNPHGHIFYTRT